MILDYRTAFDQAPIGLVMSRDRQILDCNQQLLRMFGATRPEQLDGQSFELLYPTHDEFERTGARIVASLDQRGLYADERIMKRLSGRAVLVPRDRAARSIRTQPHAAGIWSFEDLSARRQRRHRTDARASARSPRC